MKPSAEMRLASLKPRKTYSSVGARNFGEVAAGSRSARKSRPTNHSHWRGSDARAARYSVSGTPTSGFSPPSTIRTRKPDSTSGNAADTPAGPLPTTITSNEGGSTAMPSFQGAPEEGRRE